MTYYQSYKNDFNKYLEERGEIGYVQAVIPPYAIVDGLPGVRYGEVVYFESGEMGLVMSLNTDKCEILVFSVEPIGKGVKVARTGFDLKVPVSQNLLGKFIDALAIPYHRVDYAPAQEYFAIEREVPGIEARAKINLPFETGVSVVDLMIPLGKGQRELVIGDRQTGKTEFLLQTLLTQAKKGTICIYANIGKKKSDIIRVNEFIRKNNIQDTTIVIGSSSTDPVGLIYIAPYTAMTISEYFVQHGYDVLLILDDLSTHARFYREMALLANRFPGRSAYPGDIFYAHSRLLERAGNFKLQDESGRSRNSAITCLVAAESLEGDISGYIQTSLMSITDGHIFFDHEFFEQGRRPAVNYFLSVTRVGRQTQSKLRWGVNRELSSFLTLYEKTQRFIHFGAEINEGIKSTLSMGGKILSFFDQPMGSIMDLNLQIILYCLIWVGALSADGDVNLKFAVEKANTLYSTDEAFKKMIDTAINESDDFNMLLGKVSSKSKDILSKLQI